MTPSLSNRNVISIDYRGYGDSTGTPSEDGLLIDALTAWDYVNRHAAASEAEGSRVVVVGHSLGTAVTSRLVGHLADRGTSCARRAPVRR
jgi:abhydrolase domain-containing protein 12